MASTTDLDGIVVDNGLLTLSNYDVWKVNMNNVLPEHLRGIIDGSDIEPYEKPLKNLNRIYNWENKNEHAMRLIKMSCGPEMLPAILCIKDAKEAWDKLTLVASSPEHKHRYSMMLAAALEAKEKLNEFTEADRILTLTNYKTWKVYMELLLKSEYLWDIVDGSECRAMGSKTWSDKNRKALEIICTSCRQEMRIFHHADGAREVWDLLKTADFLNKDFATLAYIKYTTRLRDIHLYDEGQLDNWEEELFSARMTEDGSTALHVAARLGKVDLALNLMRRMPPELLFLKTDQGNTALSIAVEGNHLHLALSMAYVNLDQLLCPNGSGHIPLVTSAINGDDEMFRFLYSATPSHKTNLRQLSDTDLATLFTAALRVELFEFAFDLLKKFPKLATTRDKNGMTALIILAGKPSAFPSGCNPGFWISWTFVDHFVDRICYMSPRWKALMGLIVPVKQMDDKMLEFSHVSIIARDICHDHLYKFSYSQLKEAGACDAIHLASLNGIVELFVRLMIPPNMIQFIDDEFGRGLLQNAIIHRQERIFDILCQRGLNNQVTGHVDISGNNVLHCAGFLGSSAQLDKVYGPALQMQREIQWYQEVEKMVPQKYRQMKNKDGLKPKALFTKEHEDLMKQGSAWVKDTSQACMLVATLIATVMFAAAFTVPGGNNQDTGLPMFVRSSAFAVFIFADAVSLFTSCTSILMFFSLLITRYAEKDFLFSLPRKLMIGLSTLFISIVTMLTAFAATLVIALREQISLVYIPVTIVASIPVVLFMFLQFPLLVNVYKSTYGRGIFCEKRSAADLKRLYKWY